MDEGQVIVKREGGVVYLTIDRQEALNALTGRIMKRLDDIFTDIGKDDGVSVVVVTGAGRKAFVAGADVKEIKDARKGRTAFITAGQHVLSKIRTCDKPVIAAVNGYALGGGCELALACDLRIASENARFGLPEATLGVLAGYGGTQLLPRLVGPGRAKYMLFSGVLLNAEEAFRFGLVEKVCSGDTLTAEVEGLAKKIESCGPLSIKACKTAVDRGVELPVEEALRFELELYDRVANSEDAEEGLSAFLEKRKPVFKGR